MSSKAAGVTMTKSGRGKAKGMKVVSWDPLLNLSLHFFIAQSVEAGQKCRIILRHIQLPMKNDEELGKLLACAIISNGGIVPNIHQALLAKKQGRGKSKPEIRSPSQEF
ncbi:hypothetical protein ZIOFF_066448 [Zingiber officinale]|uniref:Histone H2A C-terminal domain-containing protein n=1 Tax=Zingiber officinale TaxID=94328 RepID=A0A8J5KC43_ZINOF|nr:hypothetical protein ZIOFF_066448 [Zingiber officinale]